MEYHISWWNVENLFEVEGDPDRPSWLQSQLKSELKGWTQEVLDKKLSNLAEIISMLNNNAGPDILGVCEVENVNVLEQLIAKLGHLNRNYNVALEEGDDQRGVDVGFIYDKDKFDALEQFSYRIAKRSSTRDILQITFRTKNDMELVLIGNHWPARMPSQFESEPYRIFAAETLSYWISRIIEEKGKDISILVMGDFNDDPFSRSVSHYLLGTGSRQKVINARSSPWLYNLMANQYGQGYGSFYYSGPYMFDQILASKGAIKSTSKMKVIEESAEVNNFDVMSEGSYNAPIRYGRPSSKSSYDPDGYSDHFPVSVKIKEK